ncbi:Tyrosine-protein kinase BAZ1B [Tetrabaena socialis]|uniref:Tyrosine-protein kinase BAZ1B n=1 Tax=Tetrabaena socialis TaxID=47790 RepID=A0A2J8A0V6_9CHLO|nr:Tyrosine-protein kinase BAZ1B [Tetrabaena socialis]|eukprot:PNH06118.1 Tyrosine-protein kinase BAZ1B [Tetrabaena socialis]
MSTSFASRARVFADYEEYLAKLSEYRSRQWTCSFSGRSGLSYEEALESEQASNSLLQQFPPELEGVFVGLTHHSTLRLEELITYLTDASKLHKWCPPGATSGKPGKLAQALGKPIIRRWLHEPSPARHPGHSPAAQSDQPAPAFPAFVRLP